MVTIMRSRTYHHPNTTSQVPLVGTMTLVCCFCIGAGSGQAAFGSNTIKADLFSVQCLGGTSPTTAYDGIAAVNALTF